MQTWRRVEVACCEQLHGPTEPELEAIRNATFSVEAVREREAVTDHDMAAFVDVLSQSAGAAGRWIHLGLTSSDVLDTALALQLRAVAEVVLGGADAVVEALCAKAREHRYTVCMGRTHGVHAEPTTFGVKLAGFAFEADRNRRRLARAFEQATVGAISGAVGSYSSHSPDFEQAVLASLGLGSEPVSTQVVARDRHAELLQAIALAGAGLERFATEVRNLQRTEVREAEEPFGAGQKGSSAMPHKRNPIRSERLVGIARLLRGYAQAGTEDVALWHERDISHSSVERVALPDATSLLDYAQNLCAGLVNGLVVHPDNMRANIDLTHGAVYSQRALGALIDAGFSRDEAYRLVQQSAQQAFDAGEPFRELLAARAPGIDLEAVFDNTEFVRHSDAIIERLDRLTQTAEVNPTQAC
jgi:adenylosuccinate lyase